MGLICRDKNNRDSKSKSFDVSIGRGYAADWVVDFVQCERTNVCFTCTSQYILKYTLEFSKFVDVININI